MSIIESGGGSKEFPKHLDDVDTVGLYFNDIKDTHPILLTAEEERSFARRIRRGGDARRLMEESNDDLAEEIKEILLSEIEGGKDAFERFTMSNAPLAVHIASKYQRVGVSVPFPDLIQGANKGLIEAVERFDPDEGYRFSTYAVWQIRAGIQRTIDNEGRTIRIPVNTAAKLRKILSATEMFRKTHDRDPETEELAYNCGLPKSEIKRVLWECQQPTNLEDLMGNDNSEHTVWDERVTPHAGSKMIELSDVMEKSEERSGVIKALWGLVERRLVSKRDFLMAVTMYGLVDGETKTLRETGDLFPNLKDESKSVSRETVRKAVSKVLWFAREELISQHRFHLNDRMGRKLGPFTARRQKSYDRPSVVSQLEKNKAEQLEKILAEESEKEIDSHEEYWYRNLESVSDDEKTVAILCYEKDLSYEEIARILGITENRIAGLMGSINRRRVLNERMNADQYQLFADQWLEDLQLKK